MADDQDRAREKAKAEVGLQTIGLAVLLARAGGSVEFDQAEHDAIVERYGGKLQMSIHMEVLKDMGENRTVRLTLVRKPPANAELVS